MPSQPASLDAELVLTFNPGDWGIVLALLLRRRPGMPEEITVRSGAVRYDLCAIADDLFEPAALAEPALALSEGIAAEAAGEITPRWVRTGRNLHVFTGRPGIAGFVSVPRVVIGQENAVLCTEDLVHVVAELCGSCGGPNPREVEGPGIPAGWRCFRSIRPTLPVSSEEFDRVLLALIPLPQAEIELIGGIALDRSLWLAGRPPSIRILGAAPYPGEVMIDGQAASQTEAGYWTANGWDADGWHSISYAGLSRSYEIGPGTQHWDHWPAHPCNGLEVCGALVSAASGDPAFAFDEPGTLLLGQIPGDIISAVPPHRTSIALAAPSFPPVWALRGAARPRDRRFPELVGRSVRPNIVRRPAPAVRLWCQAIRDYGRGLRTPSDCHPDTAELWNAYRRTAQSLWRRLQ
jgi:hypothetical protein